MNTALALRVFALECKRAFSYRTEFWLGFIGNVLTQFAVAILLWSAIFSGAGVQIMNGMTLRDMALYYLLIPMVERVIHGSEMDHISGEIYEGTLTRFLLYPISFFRFKYVSSLAQSLVFAIQLVGAVCLYLAYFNVPPAFQFTLVGVFLCMATIALGTVLYFFLSACLEMVAFWADNVWSIMVLNRLVLNFMGGGLLPLVFFPQYFQNILAWTPFPYLVSFPLKLLMGHYTLSGAFFGLGVMVFWSIFFMCLTAWIWRRGCRHYSGVGI